MKSVKVRVWMAILVVIFAAGASCQDCAPERAVMKPGDPAGGTVADGGTAGVTIRPSLDENEARIVPTQLKVESTSFKDRTAVLALTYNREVAVGDVAGSLSLSLSGVEVKDFRVEAGASPTQLKVTLKLPTFNAAKNPLKLTFRVRKEDRIPGSAGGERLVEHTIDLGKAPVVSIEGVYAEESAGGYYIQVYCDDYSYEDYWSRCEFDGDQLGSKVTVTPAANTTYIPMTQGFRIFGDFGQGTYRVTIQSDLLTQNGGILAREYSTEVVVPMRGARAEFTAKGRYLPRQRLAQVPVRHINVGEVEVSVRQVPEQNLVFWMAGDYETANDQNSDPIARRSYTLENKEDQEITSWLDFSGLVPADARGVFEFNLTGGSQADALRLVLTRLSLVAKSSGEGGRDLMVWAFDSETLAPRAGAQIEIMTTSNRRLASAMTNAEGLARFADLSDPLADANKAPFAVVARSGGDLTAMRFTDLQVPLSEHPVEGVAYRDDNPYRAAIYADRGVYRPGETAHLTGVVWEQSNRAPQTAVPVLGRLKDPQGKDVERFNALTNPAGMASFELNFLDFAPTGKYSFSLEIGGKAVASHDLMVEEFVPERMKVELTSVDEGALLTDAASFRLSARYLFGAQAKGEKLEAECKVEENKLAFAQYPGYSFNVWRPKPLAPLPLAKVDSEIGDNGEALITCPAVSTMTSFKGPGVVKVMASVFEAASGRTTVARAEAPVHPDRYYLGLKSSAGKAVSGQLITVDGVVADWQGGLVTEPYEIEVQYVELEAEWVYEYDEAEGMTHWRPFFREIPAKSEKVTSKDGRFRVSFTPPRASWGCVVRATAGAHAQSDLQLPGDGYVWWWDEDYYDRASRTPRPQSPEGLVLDLPESVEVGKPAEVTVVAPYAGRLLFTVESDEVIESRWVNVGAGPFTTTFTLVEFTPNVYVSALLIKDPFAESADAYMPGRAFGVGSAPINPGPFQIKLGLTAPAEVRPNSELTVTLDAGGAEGPVFATVAAVDEGVLQLTQFKSPDPLADLFRKRGLGVSTFETVGWTLLLPSSGPSSTGGDGAMETGEGAEGRVDAIKPVALWSGLVELGPDGKAVVKLAVPTYRGQLRVMAVAASPGRIGRAESEVFVRDPLVIQPTFPRFLLTDDVFVLPVFLTNTTDRAGTAMVELKITGPAETAGPAVQNISLEPGGKGTVTFLVKATGSYGAAEFSLTARMNEHVSADQATIPLLPNAPMSQDMFSAKLNPGVNDLTRMLAGWQPQYEQTTVTVTGNQYAQELGHLKYLIRYPYGCIEQTTSTTRPLLFISSLVQAMDPELLKDGTIEQKFMFGVNRLFSMQTGDGGFSYWPGEQDNTYWGTAYATHVLLDGLDAGYPIDRDRVNEALTFMERTLANSANLTDPKYGYTLAASEPYMQFVLARAGRGQTKRLQKLIAAPGADWGDLKDENIFLLKAALYLSGDRTYESDLQQAPIAAITDRRQNGWSFWSELRTRGLMLNVMEDLFPGSAAAEPLAQAIAERLRQQDSGYYTTQELSWCVSGLGKRSAGGARAWSPPRLSLDGQEQAARPQMTANGKESSWIIAGASRSKSLALTVDSIEGGNLFAFVRVEGIKPGVTAKDEDQHLQARREYRSSEGKTLDLANLQLGNLVYVELSLENLTAERLLNVALVDRFPAGFDVENPRLGRDHAENFTNPDTLWETSYMNIRDDRIELFGHLDPGQKVTVVYALRAVVSGHFDTPPLKAEVMYDPRLYSVRTGGRVTVRDPWNALTD